VHGQLLRSNKRIRVKPLALHVYNIQSLSRHISQTKGIQPYC
jgi:hypothetical protein